MGIEKKVYSFRFEEDMVARLKGYAAQENRSLSNFVETVLLNGKRKTDRLSKIDRRSVFLISQYFLQHNTLLWCQGLYLPIQAV